MTRVSSFAILLVVLLLTIGCHREMVQVSIPPAPTGSPSEPTLSTESTRTSESEREIAKLLKQHEDARRESGLSCRTPEWWRSTVVAPGAVGGSFFGSSSRVKTLIKNPNPFPVNIQEVGREGYAVMNLCPQGSVTLTKQMAPLSGEGRRVTVFYTAEAFLNGVLHSVENRPRSLYSFDYERRKVQLWEIRFPELERPERRSGR